MEDCTAAAPDDPWRGHGGPLGLERGPATSPLFGAWFAAAQEAGYPLTTDVNGYRQEGFAPFDRNIRRGRAGSARPGPTSIRSRPPPQPRGPDPDVRDRGSVFEGRRAVGVEIATGAAAPSTIRAGEVILAGGAFNTPQLLQLSGRRRGRRSPARSGIDVVADLPGVGEQPPGPPRGLHPARLHAAGLDAARRDREVAPAVHRRPVAVPAARARRDEPLRGRRLRPVRTTTSPTRT